MKKRSTIPGEGYTCFKCKTYHTTENMVAFCATCHQSTLEQSELEHNITKRNFKLACEDRDKAEAELRKYRESADKAFCVYCGHVGPKEKESMITHVKECPENPWVKLCKSLNVEKMVGDVKAAEARSTLALKAMQKAQGLVKAQPWYQEALSALKGNP